MKRLCDLPSVWNQPLARNDDKIHRIQNHSEEKKKETRSPCVGLNLVSHLGINQPINLRYLQGTHLVLSCPKSDDNVSHSTPRDAPPIVHCSIVRINSSIVRINSSRGQMSQLVSEVQSITSHSTETREKVCSPQQCYHMCPQSSFRYYAEFYSLCPPPHIPSKFPSPVSGTNPCLFTVIIKPSGRQHNSVYSRHYQHSSGALSITTPTPVERLGRKNCPVLPPISETQGMMGDANEEEETEYRIQSTYTFNEEMKEPGKINKNER